MKRICALLLLAALLAAATGCSRETAPSLSEDPSFTGSSAHSTAGSSVSTAGSSAPSSGPTAAPSEPAQPVYVYSGAICEYLLPLEDYSWQREYPVEYIMIHFSSAVVLQPEDPYNMAAIRAIFADNGVSTHYIIDRDGGVFCYIPEDRAAWHAGKGSWLDDPKYTNKMNYYAIGIELAAIGSQTDMAPYMSADRYAALSPDLIGFTQQQYESLAALVADLCCRYQIPLDRDHIIGHNDYTDRKTDPGELFDWDRLLELAANIS